LKCDGRRKQAKVVSGQFDELPFSLLTRGDLFDAGLIADVRICLETSADFVEVVKHPSRVSHDHKRQEGPTRFEHFHIFL
jgi:hypothetical protein